MELAFTRTGEGEPLVLLHGIGHRRQGWDAVATRLSRGFTVIAVDLPGFGDSPAFAEPGQVTVTQQVQALSDQLDVWGIGRVHLAGNALGALLSLELARLGRARSVTAFSPAGFSGRSGFVRAQFALMRIRMLAKLAPAALLRLALRRAFLRRFFFGILFAHGDRYPAKAAVGDALALKRTESFGRTLASTTRYPFTSELDIPVTVAWGTRDKVFAHKLSKAAAERLPQALHVTLADTGHVAMADDPQRVARLIAETARRTSD